MEFHEKLQELRKSRGLTQEELAEALYLSRTAISKWESGRGYPSIDSLKELSKYFSVTIDELLSGDKLLSIAEKENESNLQSMCDMLWGMVDVCAIFLIILPLYPNTVDTFVYSVSLFSYTEITSGFRWIYWILFCSLTCAGLIKIWLTKFKIGKYHKLMTEISLLLNIVMVFVLALARETYAIAVGFLLLVIKGMLLFKCLERKN